MFSKTRKMSVINSVCMKAWFVCVHELACVWLQ